MASDNAVIDWSSDASDELSSDDYSADAPQTEMAVDSDPGGAAAVADDDDDDDDDEETAPPVEKKPKPQAYEFVDGGLISYMSTDERAVVVQSNSQGLVKKMALGTYLRFGKISLSGNPPEEDIYCIWPDVRGENKKNVRRGADAKTKVEVRVDGKKQTAYPAHICLDAYGANPGNPIKSIPIIDMWKFRLIRERSGVVAPEKRWVFGEEPDSSSPAAAAAAAAAKGPKLNLTPLTGSKRSAPPVKSDKMEKMRKELERDNKFAAANGRKAAETATGSNKKQRVSGPEPSAPTHADVINSFFLPTMEGAVYQELPLAGRKKVTHLLGEFLSGVGKVMQSSD